MLFLGAGLEVHLLLDAGLPSCLCESSHTVVSRVLKLSRGLKRVVLHTFVTLGFVIQLAGVES